MKIRMVTRVVGVLLLIMAGAIAFAQGQQATVSYRPSEHLKEFLRNYLNHGKVSSDNTTRITVANVKTNEGKSEEYVVYVSGQQWCGSGGCTMLIVEPNGSSFNVIAWVTIVQLPIRILHSENNGHPDIGVNVQGGGIEPGYETVLSFDGKSYPDNPSMLPARKAIAISGKVIIPTTNGSVPLYD